MIDKLSENLFNIQRKAEAQLSVYNDTYARLEKLSSCEYVERVKEEIRASKWFYDTEFELRRVDVACELIQRGENLEMVLGWLKCQLEFVFLHKDTLITDKGTINLRELNRLIYENNK